MKTPTKINVRATLVNYKLLFTSIAKPLMWVGVCLGIISFGGQALAVSRLGSRGEEVKEIQRCLRKLNFLEANATGYFGNSTATAVMRFQRTNGLVIDGIVGANTQQLLESQCQSNTNQYLQLGSRGSAVRTLQHNLRKLGFYYVQVNGYFDYPTQQAIREFQNSKGLNADGIAGTITDNKILRTLNYLKQLPISVGGGFEVDTICPGEDNLLILALQKRLQELGFFSGYALGYYNPTTEDAVIEFQRRYRLPVTRCVDEDTWNFMYNG